MSKQLRHKTAKEKLGAKLIGGIALFCLSLSGCALIQSAKQEPTQIIKARVLVTPENYGQAVAKWQLAAMEDLSYLSTFRSDSDYTRGWIKASFYIGLERFAETTQNQDLLGALEQVSRDNRFELGRQVWHADDQAIGAIYAGVTRRLDAAKLLGPVRREFDDILANRPSHGLEFVEGSVSEGGCQRRLCWADAIFMGPPSWALVSNVTEEPKYRDYAIEETKATIDYLMDPETHLFFRDSRYFDKKTINGKKVFWSRGNGWVFAGLARLIEALPVDHPERDYFVETFQKMAAELIDRQRADGYWPTSLDDDALFPNPETSGTGFFGFGLVWGVNNGLLPEPEYRAATDLAWTAMTAAVEDNGKLGWVQQVGKDPKSTTPTSSQLYGAGAFLLMASEMIEYEQAR